mgnify:CR=1 FL=1
MHHTGANNHLKILHIGKYFSPFNGGLENYMRDAMVALGRRGVECAALVHDHTLSLKTSFEVFNVDGQRFQVVRVARWVKLLFTPISPGFPRHLRRLIKTFKPDILHLHLPNPSVFWALLLPSARRIPWLVHWHSDVITTSQNWQMKLFYRLYQPFERAVLRRARAIVATSLPYRDSSLPLQAWLDKCHVVPLGVGVERFVGGSSSACGRDELCSSRLFQVCTRFKNRDQRSWSLLHLPQAELVPPTPGRPLAPLRDSLPLNSSSFRKSFSLVPFVAAVKWVENDSFHLQTP